MACLLGLTPSIGAAASEVENTTSPTIIEKNQNKTTIKKFKDMVSNHKLASVCVGSELIMAVVFAIKKKDKPVSPIDNLHIHPQDQPSKEELLAMLPDLWQRFWIIRDATMDISWNAARAAALDDARGAAGDAAWNAAWDGDWDVAFHVSFANTWEPGGAAYMIVERNDREYFENLVRILQEHNRIVQDIFDQNH